MYDPTDPWQYPVAASRWNPARLDYMGADAAVAWIRLGYRKKYESDKNLSRKKNVLKSDAYPEKKI